MVTWYCPACKSIVSENSGHWTGETDKGLVRCIVSNQYIFANTIRLNCNGCVE